MPNVVRFDITDSTVLNTFLSICVDNFTIGIAKTKDEFTSDSLYAL